MSDIVGDPTADYLTMRVCSSHLDFFLVFFFLSSELRDINSKTLCFDFFRRGLHFTIHIQKPS